MIAESLLDVRPAVRESDKPQIQILLLELMQRIEKRERTLVVAELAIDADIRSVARKASPKHMAKRIVVRGLIAQRLEIELWAVRRKLVLRQRIPAARHDPGRVDASRLCPLRHRSNGDHEFCRAQHMVVQ